MNERITIRVETDVTEGLQRFMDDDLVSCRSRQDAFRHIVRDWLVAHGYIEAPPAKEDAN